MGNHCCAPAGKNDYTDAQGPPIDQMVLSGELKLKRNRKILEANMG